MTRNADPTASARRATRRASAALLAVLAGAGPALAGDRAEFDAIGFSEDGRYFAFEEFGIQDGSGFPYSNVYLIDLEEDRWVGGSPFRHRGEAETDRLGAARAETLGQARDALDEFGIVEPPTIIALNGDGEGGQDGSSISFGAPGYGLEAPAELSTLRIETFPATSSQDCRTYLGDDPLGLALTLETPYASSEIFRDAGTLPSSRGCPMAYRLYGVVAPTDWFFNAETPVAIVSVYPFGFEGPDRRFIALPIPGLP